MYLKNVWKVVTAYLVGSFALIQFANIAFPYFEVQSYVGFTSDQIMKALFIGLPLGLPIVLITAHFLSKKGSFLNNELENIDTLQNIGSYKQKIAVIPFANLNKDEDGAFLVDGIVEDLITEFSMIKEIEILSRQSCFDFREKNYSTEEFKKEFDLDYIVSGSIRIINDRLRISVELSELNDGNVLWGCKYDRVKEDIFDIQDEIVRKITISLIGEIELSSLERAKRKPTENMTSYESLLKGKEYHHRFTKEDNEESLRALDLSIQADRNNSQAYAWKACALGQAYGRGYRDDTDQLISEIMENINKAVELNNNDFEAHRMLAEVHLSLHEFDKAYDHGFKSFQLNPNDPRVTSVFGEILIRIDKLDKGVELLEKAYELDPIPQGQNTSDRRLCALLTGYYLKNDFNKCKDLINDISDIDFKSWLLSTNIHKKNNFNIDNLNWFVSGSKKFANIDIELEIDRFHLNNKELSKTLEKEAKEILN
tara:strand:- start:5131 stop:6579 length:1449 start_codon:yes stop_codon:yes gene_type:complete